MKLLVIVLALLLALSVAGFVIKSLFWLGIIAAAIFVGVSVSGAVKGSNSPRQLR